MTPEEKLINDRLIKLENIKKLGINPYPHKFDVKNYAKELIDNFDKKLKEGDKDPTEVAVAGRIILNRGMGKASFIHIQDFTGKIQAYIRKDDVGEENYNLFKNLESGDWIGIKGTIFKTQKGELSIYAKEVTCLCKSVRPLPEKYHGLKDKETRYRQRYLDLISNPEVREVFKKRAIIINEVRKYLNNLNFIEVETPVLQPLYGGTNARPFETHINEYDMKVYMRVAPELYLKRLVVGGFDKVYEIATNFRNEGADQTHNPEFTMIEWYEMCADYHVMMDRTEEMIKQIARKLYGTLQIPCGEGTIDLSNNWPRITMHEALKNELGIDPLSISEHELQCMVDENNLEIKGTSNREVLLYTIYDKLVEEKLKGPVWVIDYPKDIAPLAKKHRSMEGYVEKFQLIVNGGEIADGWSELIDPIEQRARFENEQAAMRAGNDEAHPVDEDFIKALEYGMPTLGGIGVGIDRLVMFLTNNASIRDVMLFPFMKPIKEEK